MTADKVCGWRLGFELPPRLTVSQWADAHRYIAKGTGPEEGRWRTDRGPFQREPMDAFNDSDIEVIVLKWSSQVGKTEILINALGYYIDQDPAPQMFVMPDLNLAESFSRTRFQATIEASPNLLSRIGEQRTRDSSNTLLEKTYPGGDVVFAGANSPASLASRPRRIVIADEIDKFKQNIGRDGSPIRQMFQRTENFWNAKKALASTPTIEGLSEIDDWFRKSDQRYFEVPCQHCGTFQALEWESDEDDGHGGTEKVRRVVWPKGKPEAAEYVCRECGVAWTERERHLAVRAGRWRARAPFNGIAGFHVNALASPWMTLARLAKEWEEAEGDATKEQAFVNLKLGLCYSPTRGATTTVAELMSRREDYGPERIPAGVLLITCFIDVQHDRWEVIYLGFGVNEEKWVLDYVVHPGDPTSPEDWDKLDAACLRRSFRHECGDEMAIEAIGVDAGYSQQRVMDFVRVQRAAFRPFYAVKGKDGLGRPLWKESDEKFKLGSKLYISGVDDGKTMTYRDLAVRDPAPRVHFMRSLPQSFFEGLVAERVKIEFKAGRPVPRWVCPSGKRNEPLDTFVGAVAVRHALSIDWDARRAAQGGKKPTMDFSKLAEVFN